MKVSFIIPLYNCLPLTQAMLASLRATVPAGLAHEIVLVDDGSTDGTRAWLPELSPPARVILNDRNLGFAGACNRGAAAANGEFLFFLNNDLELRPGWLEPMLAVFADHADAGVVGNVQLRMATGEVDHAGIRFNYQGKPEHLTTLPLTTRLLGWPASRRVDAVTGACVALRHGLWAQLDGFDEAYRNGGEDIDLQLRAEAMGCHHYVALRSVIRHHVSASPGRKLRDEHNSRRLLARWRAAIEPRILRAAAQACLAASWEEPRDYADPQLALEAALFLLHLAPPSGHLCAAAAAGLDWELAHWAALLDGAPAREPRAVAPNYFPVIVLRPDAI